MKTICHLKLMLQGAVLWLAAFSIGTGVTASQQQHQQQSLKDPFKHVCYRRAPVLSHVARTKAWKEGHRDVLDYGCGSGALALALVEQGAHSVVAIDLGGATVQAANERLKHVENAYARKPQLFAAKIGRPGYIGYNQKFDIVVSYMGALTDETTERLKIASPTAMECAVRATREKGCVILAEYQRDALWHCLVASLVIPVSIYAPEFVAHLSGWQLVLLGVLLARVGGIDVLTLLAPTAARNIVYSIQMKNWRFSSIVWSVFFLYSLRINLSSMFKNKRQRSHVRAELQRAGLVDVNVTHRLLYRMYEVVDKDTTYLRATRLLNFFLTPQMLVIYEGTKAAAKEKL